MLKFLPLKINALYLSETKKVLGQDIIFENIPWMNHDKGIFINANKPLDTNSIIASPFSYDNAIYLEKGYHLHFILPDYFKQYKDQPSREKNNEGDKSSKPISEETKNKEALPLAPNRWYIKIDDNNKSEEWIVESDYVWNINDPILDKLITCTYARNSDIKTNTDAKTSFKEKAYDEIRFDYVGRKYKLTEWLEKKSTDELNYPNKYLNDLTAQGWGALTFDVHYPNCRSIFGFFDENRINKNLTYTIVGWREKIKEINKDSKGIINFEIDDSTPIVGGIFNVDAESKEIKMENASIDISIADSMPEAITSLLLNNDVDIKNEDELLKNEELIEALLNYENLKDLKLDWSARVRQVTHDKQFINSKGTTKYVVKATPSKVLSENTDFIHYPKDIIDEAVLTELNKLQNKVELQIFNLYSKLEHLYIEWSIYLEKTFKKTNEDLNYLFKDLQRQKTQIHILEEEIQNLKNQLNTKLSEVKTLLELQSDKYKYDKIPRIFELEIQNFTDYYEANTPSLVLIGENEKSKALIQSFLDPYDVELINQDLANKNENLEVSKDETKSTDSNTEFKSENELLFSFAKQDKWFTKLLTKESGLEFIFQDDINLNIVVNQWATYKIEWEASFLAEKKGYYAADLDHNFDEDYLINTYGLSDFYPNLIENNPNNSPAYSFPQFLYGNAYVNESLLPYMYNKTIENLDLINQEQDNLKSNAKIKDLLGRFKDKIKANQNGILEISLGDFNDLLMQRTSNMTILPLMPNGFLQHQEFAYLLQDLFKKYLDFIDLKTKVNNLLFNPFRSGLLTINRIRFIDCFGREEIVKPNKIVVPKKQKYELAENWIKLSPRLLQPATLNANIVYTPSLPKKLIATRKVKANQPVLGWMLPVFINQRLEFYDAYGKHLGALTNDGTWENSPFDETKVAQVDLDKIIYNRELRRIIYWLKNSFTNDKTKFSLFIEEIQQILKNIMPEDYVNPSLVETISSSPLALTKINVNLFTKGEELYNLEDLDYIYDNLPYQEKIKVNTKQLTSSRFTDVKIPLSIGNINRYNDGLVGYWNFDLGDVNETTNPKLKKLDSSFYFTRMPKAFIANLDLLEDETDKAFFKKYIDENSSNQVNPKLISKKTFLNNHFTDGEKVWHSYLEKGILKPENESKLFSENNYFKPESQDNKAFVVTNRTFNTKEIIAIMHPKGSVNFKTGVLPEVTIKLPYDEIKNALKLIELNILSTPILTPKNKIEISLLSDKRYEWSWVQLYKNNKEVYSLLYDFTDVLNWILFIDKEEDELFALSINEIIEKFNQYTFTNFHLKTDEVNKELTRPEDKKIEIKNLFDAFFYKKDKENKHLLSGRKKERTTHNLSVDLDFLKLQLSLKYQFIKDDSNSEHLIEFLDEELFKFNLLLNRHKVIPKELSKYVKDNLVLEKDAKPKVIIEKMIDLFIQEFKGYLIKYQLLSENQFFPNENILFFKQENLFQLIFNDLHIISGSEIDKESKEHNDNIKKKIKQYLTSINIENNSEDNVQNVLYLINRLEYCFKAFASIENFNNNQPVIPQLILAEGWLSIKSTTY